MLTYHTILKDYRQCHHQGDDHELKTLKSFGLGGWMELEGLDKVCRSQCHNATRKDHHHGHLQSNYHHYHHRHYHHHQKHTKTIAHSKFINIAINYPHHLSFSCSKLFKHNRASSNYSSRCEHGGTRHHNFIREQISGFGRWAARDKIMPRWHRDNQIRN